MFTLNKADWFCGQRIEDIDTMLPLPACRNDPARCDLENGGRSASRILQIHPDYQVAYAGIGSFLLRQAIIRVIRLA